MGFWTQADMAEMAERVRISNERDREEFARVYAELRFGPRRWSEKAARSILVRCLRYGNTGGPVWPLCYRRDADTWLIKKRRVAHTAASELLRTIEPVVHRQSSDYDVLDGRDVVRAVRSAWGVGRRNVCEGCDRSQGFVYLLEHKPFQGRVKIGKTVNVKSRAHGLSLQAGLPIEVMASVQVCCYSMAGCVERALHIYYSEHREIGEWFQADRDQAEQLAKMFHKIKSVECVRELPLPPLRQMVAA
jgi:hypothetical protein